MEYNIPDLNRDGKTNSHDAALYHEILGEDFKYEENLVASYPSGDSEPWTFHHSIAKGALLLLFGLFSALLFSGIIPTNTFTLLLALFCGSCFVRTLLL